MATQDREILAHKAWLGFLQPVGVVVSPPALIKAQAFVNRSIVEEQQRFQALLSEDPDGNLVLADFPAFTRDVLGWYEDDLKPFPTELEVSLPDYEDVLSATWVVAESAATQKPTLVIQALPFGTDLDNASPQGKNHQGWQASPQARIERLLRENQIPAGILFNGAEIRLVYAPRGETSGHLTFPIAFMAEVAGRYVFGGMHMLLEADRIFDGRLLPEQRLSALLSESRKYQSEVSTRLAEQVLDALWELLRGFQAADESVDGRLLGETSREDPQHIYGGLLTVLLRSVFLLYAEDRGLMPQSYVYQTHYAVAGLFERLREDAGLYPDTMDHRYGAWAWMLSLFRLVFDGAHHEGLKLPARHGQLFDPDEYPFLEGRPYGIHRVMGDRIEPPRISDGVVFRVLQNLLVLDGERLSYRALDVEQIGSVYEAMMGFEVERAYGPSIALKPSGGGNKGHVVVDLGALLAMSGAKRAAWIKEQANCDVSGVATATVKDATTIEELVAALEKKISPRTKNVLPIGSLYLQPGEERRRSGSHYTPRELTEPIVRTTLRPVLEQLGPKPRPEQILYLKVCDPAMGSGAFLVEACRQLAEVLLAAWEAYNCVPEISPDEEPLLHARRLVAQRCLYGVDKNPFAVNLAKLSLWLVTLAREHTFTFVDHALKCGDSLAGLGREQIRLFQWKPQATEPSPLFSHINLAVDESTEWRRRIQKTNDGDEDGKRHCLMEAEEKVAHLVAAGDRLLHAFLGTTAARERETRRTAARALIMGNPQIGARTGCETENAAGEQIRFFPFHWEVEYPEVFGGQNRGFDAIVGNPPFLGGLRVSTMMGMPYFQWLKSAYPPAGHLCDIVAYFLRRAFTLLRPGGTFGLIATNTVAQGDTREGGLAWICNNGGTLFSVDKRLPWPGSSAVVVSVIHLVKGEYHGQKFLDGREVDHISAFLMSLGSHDLPARLAGRNSVFSQGSNICGRGFVFDDSDSAATPLNEMKALLVAKPSLAARVRPFIGGREVNQHPQQLHHRYIICLSDIALESGLAEWTELADIVRTKVKPERDGLGNNPNNVPLKRRWWAFQAHRPKFYDGLRELERLLVIARVSPHAIFTFLPTSRVISSQLVGFLYDQWHAFALLQSRVHEVWARFFSSSMKDDLRYAPSDCFETFAFPTAWQSSQEIDVVGEAYYEFRADLMIRNDQGLTDTYNRFHDPDERSPDILKLHELHAEMDRAVLNAYGWSDISTDCDFFLDFEIDEEEWNTRKKKPWRYRWPDEVHDEVLARLLDLNQKRAAEEKLKGTVKNAKTPKPKVPKKSAPPTLFGLEDN